MVAEGVEEIRLPLGKGIAGRVAQTGEVVNVEDAYSVPDFDRTWDVKHGYQTRSMLCMPLRGRSGDVIGVFAVLNKAGGAFSDEDEALLQAMGAGVAVSLENALLVDELRTTNQKLSETYDQLLQSEKLSLLGLLAGTLTHDIRNPLAIIMGNAEILLRRYSQEERVVGGAQTILKQVNRVSDLVEGVHRYARKDTAGFGPVDVHQVIREALTLTERLLHQRQVRVIRDFKAESHRVWGNAGRLEQVFMNLIQNEAQAMEQEGVLTLVTHTSEIGEMEVAVSDTGGGVPTDREADIFDVFFTTKRAEQGTGLGLAICKRIVEDHDGEIVLQNVPGKGATFLVRLPIYEEGKAFPDGQNSS